MTITQRTTHHGEPITWMREGKRLASITEQANGTFYVAMHIDHGDDGKSFCDSGTYKTKAGAIRKARGFLK